MLTGRAAFHGSSSSEMFDGVLNHDPIPFLAANPNIPVRLIDICGRLLEKDPSRRYQDCRALLEDLKSLLDRNRTFTGREAVISYLNHPEEYEEPPISSDDQNPTVPTSTASTAKDQPFFKRHPAFAGILLGLILIAAFGTIRQIIQPLSEPLSAQPAVLEPVQPEPETEAGHPVDTPADSSTQLPALAHLSADVPAENLSISPASVAQPVDSSSGNNEQTATTIDSVAAAPSEPLLGELNVLCEPYCEVFVDSVLMGEAPPLLALPLPPGPHHLTLKNPNLPDYSRDIVIEAGRRDTLMAPLRQLIGTVEIKVHPWADVYIDSVHYGVMPPIQTILLKPGVHALTLVHPSLGRVDTTLLIVAGEKLSPPTFNLKLE